MTFTAHTKRTNVSVAAYPNLLVDVSLFFSRNLKIISNDSQHFRICSKSSWWAETRKKVKNAAVFLDPVSCECLHWAGGLPFLLEYGASCVKEFSTFEVVPATSKKAVFILSSAIQGTNYDILEHLIRGSKLEYCVVITSAHVSLQNMLQWSGTRDTQHQEMEAFQNLEEDILDWMGNMNYTAEVFSYPLSTVHPTLDIFLIPSAKPVAPFFPSDLGYLNDQLNSNNKQAESSVIRSINELTYSSLPFESQVQVRQLCHNLNQLLQHINGKEEIFTVGSFSRIVGTELEALNAARTRRKIATNKISVILVDRVLDLASATRFTSENLYDRMLHTLERLHEYSNDVSICMNDRPREEEFTYSAPGCLAPQSDWKHGWKLMDQLFHHSRQQAAERIKTEFIDACDEDELSSLSDVLTRRSNDWDFIEKFTHLYQAARGVQQTQISEKVDRLSRLEAIQKGLMESVDDPDSPSPLIQILHLIKTRKESGLTLDDIFALLVHIYSLAGDLQEELFTLELEDRLKGLLAENIVHEDSALSEPIQNFVGLPIDEIKAHRAAQKIVEQLHHIGFARNPMKKYGSLYKRTNPAIPVENISFIQQLIEDIFDPSVLDCPDVEHKSAGLKDLLKTGFSLFVNVRKPRPSDNNVVLFYVVGGIRPDEAQLIRRLFRQKSPSHSVLIGSSHFVATHDIIQQYLLRKNPTC